jgi:glycosyltransferase involved in cell wall biosynthesis
MRNPFFTIAIPTYEMYGKGVEFLEFNLERLYEQTFQNFEVVISDHSENDEIKNLCSKFSSKLNFKYIRNESKRGNSSANLNNAIKNSTGSWIKILFQDDFLFYKSSLEDIHDFILNEKNIEWIASACEHTNDGVKMYKVFFPSWNNDIYLGKNTISSPSVITFKNKNNNLFFNEDLIWLMDVEFYKRMYDSYGQPFYLNKINVVNRTWKNSVSNTLSNEIKIREHNYMLNRFKK